MLLEKNPIFFWLFSSPGSFGTRAQGAVDRLTHSHSQPCCYPSQERTVLRKNGPDIFWGVDQSLSSPAGWTEMAFPGFAWTRRSLNSSIFGDKVSYIHMDSSSRWFAGYLYDHRFQEASGNHSFPHPQSPGSRLDPSIRQFQAHQKGTSTVGWQHSEAYNFWEEMSET